MDATTITTIIFSSLFTLSEILGAVKTVEANGVCTFIISCFKRKVTVTIDQNNQE